jgi:hypothetical protein
MANQTNLVIISIIHMIHYLKYNLRKTIDYNQKEILYRERASFF